MSLPFTDRTLFLLFRKGVPPLVSVSVMVLNFGLSVRLNVPSGDFFFVAFVLVLVLVLVLLTGGDLDLDFDLGLGFTVPMNKYARYKFRNGFDLQLPATFYSILSDKNSHHVNYQIIEGG